MYSTSFCGELLQFRDHLFVVLFNFMLSHLSILFPFSSTKSENRRAEQILQREYQWEIFPSSLNFFDFCFQWFAVFLVEVIHILCLFLGIWFFEAIVNGIVSYILSQYVPFCCIERILIFVSYFGLYYFAEAVYGV
jgi:hypothetical protein